MKLSFITDEATQSFSEAVKFAKDMGFMGLELRSVEDKPIDLIPGITLRAWREKLDKEGLWVSCVAGSFYKCTAGSWEREMDKLQRLCDAADILGCSLIRGFAFFPPDSGRLSPVELAPFFEKPAELMRKRGKCLVLEADPSVNTTNHKALAALLERLDKKVFGAVYDPGNDLYDPMGETPYPDGYEAIRPWLLHIHVKDVIYKQGMPQCVAPGEGLVGWPMLLSRLVSDGYDGWLSLETHYRKNTVLTKEQMRLPSGSGFSNGGLEATKESAERLRAMIEKAGGI